MKPLHMYSRRVLLEMLFKRSQEEGLLAREWMRAVNVLLFLRKEIGTCTELQTSVVSRALEKMKESD